jgi:Uma2 family endonuclease
MTTAIQPITLQEFLRRPDREDGRREELIEGEIVLSPEPKPLHSEIISRLQSALAPLEKLGFVIRGGFSCILPSGSAPGPDLAAIREKRWREAIRNDAYLQESPELVIEVRSPSNRQLGRKASLYLQHGAEAVWVVYPKRHAIVIYDQDGMHEARENEQLDFHGVKVEVAAIFR